MSPAGCRHLGKRCAVSSWRCLVGYISELYYSVGIVSLKNVMVPEGPSMRNSNRSNISRPMTACQGMLLVLRGAPCMGDGTLVSNQGISIVVSNSGYSAVPVTPEMGPVPGFRQVLLPGCHDVYEGHCCPGVQQSDAHQISYQDWDIGSAAFQLVAGYRVARDFNLHVEVCPRRL